MNKPFFSVIVPAFNSAAYIRKALDSVKAQTFTDYEIVIVCDNCVDNTKEIALEYTDRVFDWNHHEGGPARNKGLDEARGEWVLFLDDDDWFLHEFAFQMLADVIGKDNKEIDILCFSFIWRTRGYTFNSPVHLWPAIWNKCWRREFIGDHRFPAWEHSEDLGFAREMHPKGKLFFFDTPLYYYNYMRPGCESERIAAGKYDEADVPDELKEATAIYKRTMSRINGQK